MNGRTDRFIVSLLKTIISFFRRRFTYELRLTVVTTLQVFVSVRLNTCNFLGTSRGAPNPYLCNLFLPLIVTVRESLLFLSIVSSIRALIRVSLVDRKFWLSR